MYKYDKLGRHIDIADMAEFTSILFDQISYLIT